MSAPRIDCGISVVSDEDLRARDVERAALRAAAALVRRVRAIVANARRAIKNVV